MFKLYYAGQFVNEHSTFEEARLEACSVYFEYRSYEWVGDGLPPGFFVSCQGQKAAA